MVREQTARHVCVRVIGYKYMRMPYIFIKPDICLAKCISAGKESFQLARGFSSLLLRLYEKVGKKGKSSSSRFQYHHLANTSSLNFRSLPFRGSINVRLAGTILDVINLFFFFFLLSTVIRITTLLHFLFLNIIQASHFGLGLNLWRFVEDFIVAAARFMFNVIKATDLGLGLDLGLLVEDLDVAASRLVLDIVAAADLGLGFNLELLVENLCLPTARFMLDVIQTAYFGLYVAEIGQFVGHDAATRRCCTLACAVTRDTASFAAITFFNRPLACGAVPTAGRCTITASTSR